MPPKHVCLCGSCNLNTKSPQHLRWSNPRLWLPVWDIRLLEICLVMIHIFVMMNCLVLQTFYYHQGWYKLTKHHKSSKGCPEYISSVVEVSSSYYQRLLESFEIDFSDLKFYIFKNWSVKVLSKFQIWSIVKIWISSPF